MSNDFFKPKRILKHKNHVTLNEGEDMQEKVQHLEKKGDEFVELNKNEAAKKYGSKKLVRNLDFNSRDGIEVGKAGLGNTPEWFDYIIPVIDWENYRTFLYEIDRLWLNMFFVRELYAEEGTGREQILQLSKHEDREGLTLDVLCQLDYAEEKYVFDVDQVDGFIKVSLEDKVKVRDGEEGRDFDVDVDFKHSYFSDDQENLASGLREILTGICLKHGYLEKQIKFKIQETEDEVHAVIMDKDFTVRFSKDDFLKTGVSSWVKEMFLQDGCPLVMIGEN